MNFHISSHCEKKKKSVSSADILPIPLKRKEGLKKSGA